MHVILRFNNLTKYVNTNINKKKHKNNTGKNVVWI